MALVELRGVTKTFPATSRRGDPVVAIDGVDLDVEKGDIYAIVGYSGAGKSTLVRLVNALESATSGSVVVDGVDVTGLSERGLQKVRLDIGMVFQQFNLFSSRTVYGNVAYPLQVAGVPKSEHRKRVSELLHFVGLADKALSRPDELSGGQKQRVGIARALATSPKLLLADESTSALDPETTQEVLALLQRVNRELGITIIVITHEMDVVRSIAHKVAVMQEGRIVEQGKTFDIFSAPRQEVTKRFVGTVVDDDPAAPVLDALRARHGGRFVKVELRDPSVRQSDVFTAITDLGVRFELVHGGIEQVQGVTFGNLVLALEGAESDVQAAISAAGRLVTVKEIA